MSYSEEKYAIVEGEDGLLKVVQADSESWSEEYYNYKFVREVETRDIIYFVEEYEAIDFMLEKFDEELINPKYLETLKTDRSGRYIVE